VLLPGSILNVSLHLCTKIKRQTDAVRKLGCCVPECRFDVAPRLWRHKLAPQTRSVSRNGCDTGEALKGTLPVLSASLAGGLLTDPATVVGKVEEAPVVAAVGATPIITAETDATTKGRRDRREAACVLDSAHGRPARRRGGCSGGGCGGNRRRRSLCKPGRSLPRSGRRLQHGGRQDGRGGR